jgi:hypothetical protein
MTAIIKNQEIYTWMTKAQRKNLGINKTTIYVRRDVKNVVVEKDERTLDDIERRFGTARIGGRQVVVWSELDGDVWDIDVDRTRRLK